MMTVLIVSQILSWIVILGLGLALLALARQIGVLHEGAGLLLQLQQIIPLLRVDLQRRIQQPDAIISHAATSCAMAVLCVRNI